VDVVNPADLAATLQPHVGLIVVSAEPIAGTPEGRVNELEVVVSKAYGYSKYGGPETETWFDRPVPTPGPSELVIEVRAIGVNPVDYKIRSGAMADPAATPDFPLALGVEAAGVVVATGSDVDGFTKGDEVLGKAAPEHGTYGEHAVLLASSCVAKPPQLSFTDAAAVSVAGTTAWEALDALHLNAGETLLINGIGGGVGVIAAQLARDRDVAVFGVGSGAKRDITESVGATLIRYDAGPVADEVRALLPDGVDAVFDLIGGDALSGVAGLASDPARIVSIVDPAVEKTGGTLLVATGSGAGAVAELITAGKVDPKVLQVVPFDEAPQALRGVESGHALGNVVIEVPSP
jgi:NADPH:quinone reductase-like Zn-dependent oxidoreductase